MSFNHWKAGLRHVIREKNYSSNVTTMPKIRWYLYFKLQCELEKLPPTQAAPKCKIFRSHYVFLVLRRAYLPITNPRRHWVMVGKQEMTFIGQLLQMSC